MTKAGEKTEEPTPRRIAEARRHGDVALSRDLTSASATLVAVAALVGGASTMGARLLGYWRRAFIAAPVAARLSPAIADGVGITLRTLAPALLAASVAALVVGLLQTRGLMGWGGWRGDRGGLSLTAGFRRVLGGQAAVEVAQGLLKTAAVGLLLAITGRPLLRGITSLSACPPERVVTAAGTLLARVAVPVALLGLAMAAVDYVLVRGRHRRRLRMTRDELRREIKDAEGDPAHRAERHRLHRELAEQRMLEDVRKADVIVVNPEHIAVALRYDRDGEAAPIVLASGERLLAERIKQIAREAGVPVLRDVSLARSLRTLPEGEEIPPALFEAVAEILRVVYAMTAAATSPATIPSGETGATADKPAAEVRVGRVWKRV